MVVERRDTLGVWLDRLLIAAIGCIFIYFGTRVEKLTDKVGSLAENMATIVAEIKFTNEKTEKLERRLDQHLIEYGEDKKNK